MHSYFFYLNDSISPSIYSPTGILSTNSKIRILLGCEPSQVFYPKLLIENQKKDTITPFNSSPSSISKFKKRSSLQSGDQINIYYKNELLGNGTFDSHGARFFIWHDAEGNERFQIKDGLLTIKKV